MCTGARVRLSSSIPTVRCMRCSVWSGRDPEPRLSRKKKKTSSWSINMPRACLAIPKTHGAFRAAMAARGWLDERPSWAFCRDGPLFPPCFPLAHPWPRPLNIVSGAPVWPVMTFPFRACAPFSTRHGDEKLCSAVPCLVVASVSRPTEEPPGIRPPGTPKGGTPLSLPSPSPSFQCSIRSFATAVAGSHSLLVPFWTHLHFHFQNIF